jgi:hypothetical protein
LGTWDCEGGRREEGGGRREEEGGRREEGGGRREEGGGKREEAKVTAQTESAIVVVSICPG